MKRIKSYLCLLIGLVLINCNLVKAGELKIHAIECKVQGDATLLETNGKYLLMDTCLKDDENQVLNYLDQKKVTTFDLYLSHYHVDHYGLIMDILNNTKYTVKNIYVSEYDKNNNILSQINEIAEQKNINMIYLENGSNFAFGDAYITIVGPLSGTETLTNHENNASLVAKIKVDNTTFFTAADIEKEQEELLLKSGIDLKADIMKLSHHGGYTSNTEEFIKAVNPKFAYYTSYKESIFAGSNWNKDTIPNVSKYTNVLSTGYNGNLLYDIKDDEISVTATRNYLEATVHYIDDASKTEFKVKTYPFNKNTVFHYVPETISNYNYMKSEGLADESLSENQDINLHYQKIVKKAAKVQSTLATAPTSTTSEGTETETTPTASSNDTTETTNTTAVKNYCTEINGTYYDDEGNAVSKENYYANCNIVENPKTGLSLPILILVSALILGICIMKVNKKGMKRI